MKSCILAPIHSPKFHQAEVMVRTYNQFFGDDLFLLFSNQQEEEDFRGRYSHLKYQHFCYEPVSKSPAAEKKLWGVKWILENTNFDYVGVIDVDTEFFRYMDYDTLFQEYYSNGKVYGHSVICSSTIYEINSECTRFFPEQDKELLQQITQNFSIYFWFNEIPVYERHSFMEFQEYVNLEKAVQLFDRHDFEYIFYAYYLFVKGYMKLDISSSKIESDNGSLIELQTRLPVEFFESEFNRLNPMWIYRPIDNMKNTFLKVHVDR